MVERSMSAPGRPRRLIVNADDFGRSHFINEGVRRAHREGILTSASLMVNEPAFDEAVALAGECPRLGVGLHLVLACGKATLSASQVPGLVDRDGQFSSHPVRTGTGYFFKPSLRPQLRAEIRAQFDRFRATGLPLDHLNGHLHLHLHPAVFPILVEEFSTLGWTRIRLTRDPLWFNLRLAKGRLAYRLAHAMIYAALSACAVPSLRRLGARHTNRVFGLLQNAHVDERFLLRLLEQLPPGDSELYSHPSLDESKHEFEALVSPRVLAKVRDSGIALSRYSDL